MGRRQSPVDLLGEHRPMIRWLVSAVLLLTLTGCALVTGESSSPDQTPPPTAAPSTPPATTDPGVAPPRSPEPGACYRLSYRQVLRPTSSTRAIRCTRSHTAVTVRVGELDTVVAGHLLAVDSARVRDQLARICPAALAEHLGGSMEQRRLSMFRPAWFTPSLGEAEHGANWFRCDLVAVSGRQLVPLPDRTRAILATPDGRRRFGRCATAEPGTAAFVEVVCSAPHRWRALRSVDLPGDRYPAPARLRAAGNSPCEAAARAVAENSLDFQWGWQWPTAEQWAAGHRYGVCWAPD